MKFSDVLLAASVAIASAGSGPVIQNEAVKAECQGTVVGAFKVTVVENKVDKRAAGKLKWEVDCQGEGGLIATLENDIVKDQDGRTGYISAAHQLQFDDPPQSGAIVVDGFAACRDGYLSLRESTQFFQCRSGDHWNIYDQHLAEQCGPVYLGVQPCAAKGEGSDEVEAGAGAGAETVIVSTKIITVMGDGQPQIRTAEAGKVVCKIEDGQSQGHTTPCAAVATQVSNSTVTHSGAGTTHTTSDVVSSTGSALEPTDDDESGAWAVVAPAGTVLLWLAMAVY